MMNNGISIRRAAEKVLMCLMMLVLVFAVPAMAAQEDNRPSYAVSADSSGKAAPDKKTLDREALNKKTSNKKASNKKASNTRANSVKEKVASKRKIQMTGNRDVDYLVELYLQKAGVKKTMTDKQILRKIYDYITLHCNYPYAILRIHYNYSSSSIRKAATKYKKKCDALKKSGKITYNSSLPTTGVGDIWRGVGNCIVHARMFDLMAAHMGIKCGFVSGPGHSWACAWVNGTKYYFDPGYSIHYYYAHRKITSKYFMMTPAYARSHGHTPRSERIYK